LAVEDPRLFGGLGRLQDGVDPRPEVGAIECERRLIGFADLVKKFARRDEPNPFGAPNPIDADRGEQLVRDDLRLGENVLDR
jgi:hypothetical protein